MTGIIGVFERGGRQLDTDLLSRMGTTLRHRSGPTGGRWHSAVAGLGSLTGSAPRVRGDLVIAGTARLDNREQLQQRLGADRDGDDVELILGAYERWGEACPQELLGDFAFAIWHEAERRLFCARDHFGVRPLYYALLPSRLLFAPEIKAILADPEVPRALDRGKIADYLGQAFVDQDRTFYEAVRRLPPGHSMVVTESDCRLQQYWRLDPDLRVTLPDDEAYATEFRARLTEALRCRLQPSDRTAFLLSGGLDSSALVSLTHRHRDAWSLPGVTTLSTVFPEFQHIDEREFIDQVLAGHETDAHFVSASDTSPLHEVEAMLDQVDEPFYSPNLYIYWSLARRAQELGVRVIVDGIDGDTTVSHGTEHLCDLLRRGRLFAAVAESRRLARSFRSRASRFLWHWGVQPALRPARHAIARAFGRGLPQPPATVRPEFAREIGWSQRLRDLLGPRLQPATSHRQSHYQALTSALLPHCLEVHDKASAAFGLEHRHPYFDRRLVEFCYGIPAGQRLSGGLDRAVQRRAMAGIVPDPIRLRVHKSYWADQFQRGFLVEDRDRIESVLRNPGPLADFVRPEALEAAFARCQRGPVPEDDGMNLWLGVTLGLWLRRISSGGASAGADEG